MCQVPDKSNGCIHSRVVPLPKNPYGNFKMAIYFDIINLIWNYMVINELKNPCEEYSFKLIFNVHVKKIKIEIHPKMIMIWTHENMAHFRPFKSS